MQRSVEQPGLPRRRARFLLRTVIGLVAASLAFLMLVHTCAYGGGMGAGYRECRCLGYEFELYDHTPADGRRKTICVGIVDRTNCFQYRGGPEIPCNR